MQCPYCKAELEKTTLKKVLCMNCFRWVDMADIVWEAPKASVSSGNDGTAGLEYRVTGQEATVTAYYGSYEKVRVAEYYDRYPVKSISERAFAGCRHLKELIIPDSAERIEKEACKDCIYLKKISLGRGIRRIGEGAFYHCVSLNEVVCQRKPRQVAVSAFGGCYNLPASVKIELYSGE